jgi:asparagine synthase (glutamine-hydrolysing)
MQVAAQRFPVNPPVTKEAYLYREMFESCFPSPAAAACVPGGPSIACSTPTAFRWDQSFAANPDPSGRAVRSVHKAPTAPLP